ncbi:LytTR family DNA-binding domain-containing protein [Runella aurantiaca]|uniref:LytTR family transcriptional regulator n=1 Tax=Runella aurantiaca TaxID=2282308 RepID=A0A369IBI0_9BACT|nr:LytTR family DNA-binding domain-containing protein [Runella aurantiaca]RDB06230.1 LytTR family transcriptional regulator [Runella aurantiaca]
MENCIILRDCSGFIHLLPDEILRLEGDRNYTHVLLTDGRKLLFSKTIGYLLELMPEGTMLRISKSHAINPTYLQSIFLRRRQRYVYLTSGEKFEVSRRRAQVMRKQSKQQSRVTSKLD